MPRDTFDLPVITREATIRAVRAPDAPVNAPSEIEVVWTTGATVQRARWEGWDERVEYDEELVVSPEALRLDRLNGGGPFLNSHRTWGGLEDVLGSVVPGSVKVTAGQGVARIRLTQADDAKAAVQRILEGTVNRVSVGYRVHEYQITKREGARELWRAVDWEPFEISAVAMPADPGAVIRADEKRAEARHPCVLTRADTAASAAHPKGMTMPDHVTSADPTQVRTTSEAALAAPVSAPVTPTLDARDAARAAVTEERQRSAAIRALCARHALDGAVADQLVNDGVSLDVARDAVLEKLAERDPMQGRTFEPAQPRRDNACDLGYRDAISAALLHRHDPGRHDLVDAAREFRGLTLLELARSILDRHGVTTRGMSKMELAGAAFQMRAGGYHSTGDFPSILANVANRTLRLAYEGTPRTFARWARRATISDFKPTQRTQLGGAPDLLKTLESGEFQYGTMGEAKETYSLATYGRIIGITRQTLINDDLDAFSRIPAAFGASAADIESDIVYAILTGNPTMGDGVAMFHATHGNLAGSGAAISEATLATAYRAMGAQTGLEGRKINVMPRFLVVPPGTRQVEARKNVTATTPASASDVNAFADQLEVITEPRLMGSPDPWFLLADSARIDTVEYAYLDGQDGVYTETRVGFEVDGMEIKARHDFAAAAIDHRGAYKNAGA